jgi:hypothetical protein
VITCKTYLKRLNITQPMAEHLLPFHDLHAPPTRRSSGGCAALDDDGGDSPRGASKPGSSYELLFKEDVSVVDREGARFRVQYEGVSCNQQKHLRLTSGWRDYIRAHNVEVGECRPHAGLQLRQRTLCAYSSLRVPGRLLKPSHLQCRFLLVELQR